MLLLNNYTKFNMMKNTYQKNTKTNEKNILLITILSLILIISMFSALLLFSEKSDFNVIEERNNTLNHINNNNIENFDDIIYKIVNNNNFVYCPFKEGNDDDKDSVLNVCDNCPIHYNPDQLDNDLDGLGNICDPNPNHAENKGGGNGNIIRCVSNADCGNNGFIEQPFCSSNNVNQLFRTWHCMNSNSPQSFCVSNNEQRNIQDCNLGCSNGQCISQPPQPPTIPQCDDGIDNDGDNLIDFPADPGCSNRTDNSEIPVNNSPAAPQCDDGIDNDNDRRIDYPADPECSNRLDNSE